ncbi:MalY/PatB family protein [Clostridium sp. Marseille-P299]|uniref:MalY/PatB family protein n=1 Tax=Clostridium sp. Marseille-P299 TaxID=1805477 RepID=UPI000830D94E|nr:MalY/PatB family protein [Clostridium sp. Marseille-P299]
MKKYDSTHFDEIIDRKNTNSLKYDFAIERGRPEDILPLWVADMDFKVADEITDAISKVVSHGIYGYTDSKDDYFDALKNWYLTNYSWEIKKEWLVKTPGVVYAIATAIRAFTNPGDAIIIQQPVYYPFFKMIQLNDRVVVNSPLVNHDGFYEMNFEEFEQKIIDNKVKVFILCSPHNPVGRVWTTEELTKIGEICLKHNVLVISDEIHSDFIYEGYKHTVFSSLSEEFKNNSIICTAPSKTFNLAGLQISNVFIANEDLRKRFIREKAKTGYDEINTIGLTAAKAAYSEGKAWLDGMRSYLKDNLDYVREFLNERLPMLKLVEPQGTYLIWIDFRGLGLTEPEREDLIVNKAKLWLDTGSMFGVDGKGYERINIACPRSILKKALEQLEGAIKGL